MLPGLIARLTATSSYVITASVYIDYYHSFLSNAYRVFVTNFQSHQRRYKSIH
ncbi:MAG: hypothetical protein ACI971_002332 [Colwellia sp.]|jgi:hypothetical protein